MFIYLPSGPHGEKVGVDDYLAGDGERGIDDLIRLATTDLKPLADEAGRIARDDDGQKSQATILIEIAQQCDLFCDALGEALAAIQLNGHRETLSVRSGSFKRWLAREFFTCTGSAANGSSIADALAVIEARAQFEGDVRAVWLRVGEGTDRAIYIDLGGTDWDAVRITRDGWTIVANPQLHFRRSPMTGPMPHPRSGGSLELLRPFLSVREDDDFVRIVGWMVGALRPRGPYPLLAFVAEQGAGKSFTATLLRSLVDPAAVPLRGMPREERDLVIAARSNHVIALDNVSSLPQWLSDALCRIATGAGWATRSLYTDADEQVFSQSRPAILTGIEDFIANGDLLDRSMLVALQAIPESARRQELLLLQDFDTVKPLIFGALLDAVSCSMRNHAHLVLPALPRMADFASWVTAAEPALGWADGTFLAAYMEGIAGANDVVLDGSVLAEPLRMCVAAWGDDGWQGTASDLLKALCEGVSEETRRRKDWPKTARGLSGHLRRLAPTLRNIGIDVTFGRATDSTRTRLIVIRPSGSATTVRTVQSVRDEGEAMDGAAYESDAGDTEMDGLAPWDLAVPESAMDDPDGLDGQPQAVWEVA